MKLWKYIFGLLLLIFAILVIALFQLPDGNLHVIACDVGQGDAILVTYKNIQILTDGGPNNKVLDCLSKHVPFWDREIELVISTHPQKDHYFGLIEVFKRYKVDNYLYNDVKSGNQDYQVLEKDVGSSGVNVIRPYAGQVIRVDVIQLDILNPSGKFETLNPKSETANINDIGIVTLLKYGQFKALFTADVENKISDGLSALSEVEGVNYLKVNHHGSKNGLTQNLLEKIVGGLPRPDPQHESSMNNSEKTNAKVVGVISSGKNNIYGHPHKEILDLLGKYNVKILRTDEMGGVEVITDGGKYWIEK